jgi:hypothetical protein
MDHAVLAGISWDTKSLFGLPLGVVAFGMLMLQMNDRSRNAAQTKTQNNPPPHKPATKSISRPTPTKSHVIRVCANCGDYPMFKNECEKCGFIDWKNFKPGETPDVESVIYAQEIEPEFKDCPKCAEQIKYAAIKCRFCMSEL